jgi:hypothetical protein
MCCSRRKNCNPLCSGRLPQPTFEFVSSPFTSRFLDVSCVFPACFLGQNSPYFADIARLTAADVMHTYNFFKKCATRVARLPVCDYATAYHIADVFVKTFMAKPVFL